MGPEAELRRIVATRQVYLVPRADGRLLVGATVEERGFDKRVTVAAVQGLLAAAVEALPGLVEMPLVDAWAGLRPGTSDGMPILGPAEPEGLVLATGHHRNGILLAPITAELIAQTLTSGEVPAMLAPFAPSSFVRVPSGVR
jgi:glycine oxidase